MAPILYNYDNLAEGIANPSTVVTDTGLTKYFEKYLFQKFLSVFEWDIPKEWPRNYFETVLYMSGKIAVLNTDRYGVICQQCGLRGWDIYYQPTHAVIANPRLTDIQDRRIGEGCEIIKMAPDFSGVFDIVKHYAELMAITTEAIDNNIFSTRVATVYGCKDDKQATSFRKMAEKITAGLPAVFVDRSLFDDEGNPQWQQFQADLSRNYLADRLLVNLKQIESAYDAEIGIKNANTEKKERLIVDEVNANNDSTGAKMRLWLETMQESCEKVNALYGLKIAVKRREINETEENTDDDNRTQEQRD